MNELLLRTSCIIIIGNEILSGHTRFKFKIFGSKTTFIGIIVNEVRIIPDIKGQIINSVNELRNKYNFVFTSGGIDLLMMILQQNV